MKVILLIVILSVLPEVSSANENERNNRAGRKEKKEMKRQQRVQTKKFDGRSRTQKRKDRNVLFIIALAGALVFSHIQE